MKNLLTSLAAAIAAVCLEPAYGQSTNYRHSTRLNSSDYMYGAYGPDTDKIFDQMSIVDLSADLGIGSDCGRLNVGNTLRASLDNIFNERYFRRMGRNIVAASPMLLTCYLSPTWCSILKHSRLRASYLMQTRLSQCGMIDKYTDSRSEEFAQARQSCVRREIDRQNGDFEAAMETCQNIWNRNLTDWAGDNRPETRENRVIDSSAKWAGASSAESGRIKRLLTSMVGDTVVNRGRVSVDYGGTNKPKTPRTYLTELESQNYNKLCNQLLGQITAAGGARSDIKRRVSNSQLRNLSSDSAKLLINHQTLMALAAMPPGRRNLACKKLSDSISMTMFATDMAKTLDFMTATVAHNPHLPANRQAEAERKRRALKDQIELTLTLNKHKNEPLNKVLYQIDEDANQYRGKEIDRALSNDKHSQHERQAESRLFNCSDNYLCN